MKNEDFKAVFHKTFGKLEEILLKKGHDYATEDMLSNFKRVSGAASILNIDVQSPIGYALFMCLLKLDRINNLITSNKTPANESVHDSFIDELGYVFLALSLFLENLNGKEGC